jgi:parvulin-like peptidyl-prolyl isomerase
MTRDNRNDTVTAKYKSRTWGRRSKILLGGLLALAICGIARHYWGAAPASANPSERQEGVSDRSAGRPSNDARHAAPQDQREPAAPSDDESRRANADGAREPGIPAIVATVNTQRISRDDLAKQCIRHFGKEVLESMVNKQLIALECQRQGIRVTRDEVDWEIERLAKRFKIPVDQWKKLLKKERNITPEQYADEIIWPTIALRKLAGGQIKVSEQDVRREFETQFGDQVKVRLIAVSSLEKAKRLRAQAAANPENFGNLAKSHSEDAASASAKGIINPIRRHGSYEEIEEAVFNMSDGQVSPVIKAGGQFVILKREGLIEGRQVDYQDARPKLEEFLRDRQTRSVAQEVFQTLQDRAKKRQAIQIVWNDPAKRQKMPGVAALVYDDEISLRELADQCMARHGQEVLEGAINHKILELECRKRSITVSDRDIDREIAKAALVSVKAKPDGSPDVEAWLNLVKKRGISLDVYRNELIWTAVVLKKLVGSKIAITEEDLQKGYDANYGERVRCKAIVLNDMRRAQQVFEMARKDGTSETFGKLASQYSVEPGSQALEGDVPPIKRFGGQPSLEDEAFQLKPGEMSGIIQLGNKYVILRCEGRTKPVGVKFAEVRDEIHRDLHEKKLQLAMEEQFESLQDAAVVDNYLAGTSHSPRPPKLSPTAQLPSLKQIPAR